MDPYQAAERFRQEAEGLDREAITALVRAYGDVWQRLDRELLSLRALLPAEGEAAPRPVTLLQLERVEALRRQIAQALAELVPYADEQALTAEQRALVLGQAHAQALLRAAAGPGVTASFARIDPEAARALVGFLQNGAPLRALFERLAAGTADAAGRALLAGVAAGTPYSAVARELRGVLGTSLAHAITITSTETHRAYREAHHLTYQANADLVRGWVWLSARGPRTCATCWALHGTFHPLDERQLGHPRCRCTSVPVTRPWSQLGVPGAGPTHPPVELGVDAFARAPEEVQRAVLGPQKFQAYKEGRIGLEDLAVFRPDPVWGGAWVEPSLRQALAQHLDEKPWLRATPPPPPVRHPAFRRGRPAPPEPAPEPQPVPAGPFPASLDGLTVVRRLGGSTGAELVRDELGRTFVRKRGASPDHVREEVLADTLYRALGANVPLARLYETPQGPVKLAQVIEGESLDAVLTSGDAARIARVRKNLQQHLAADALLGNWDVIGLKRDNILVDAQDQVWRIDNGGALRYRAQGAPKGEAWDGHLRDLFTLRDPARNREAAAVFREVPWRDVVGQLREVAALRDHVLEIAPPELRETLASRLDEARHLADVGQRMLDDRFTESYVEEFSRHIVGLRAAGVVDALPRKLEPRDEITEGRDVVPKERQWKPYDAVDENGRPWDDLRNGVVVRLLKDYVDGAGGDWEVAARYLAEQAAGSWRDASLAAKGFLATEARVPPSPENVWWRAGMTLDDAREQWQSMYRTPESRERYRQTMTAYHAFTYELLSRVEFPAKEGTVVRLFRTEEAEVMRKNKVRRGAANARMPRGYLESFSVWKVVRVSGAEITVQRVPLHRVFATFLHERFPGHGETALYDDSENEFVVIPDGIPFAYIDTKKPARPTTTDEGLPFAYP